MNQQAAPSNGKQETAIARIQPTYVERYFAHKPNLEALSRSIPKTTSLTAERFARAFGNAFAASDTLPQCSQESVLRCLFDAASTGLIPNTGAQQAALVPYNIGDIKHAKFMIMKRGYIDLALRDPEIEEVQALCVFEKDHFEWEDGHTPRLLHRPETVVDPGKVRCAYAWARFKGGRVIQRLYRKHQIDGARDQAVKRLTEKQLANSPWELFYDRMAEKYAIKHFCANVLRINEDMEQALSVDEVEHFSAPTIDVHATLIPEVKGPPPPPPPPPAEDGPSVKDFWDAAEKSDLPKPEVINILKAATNGVEDPKLAGPEGRKRAIEELLKAAKKTTAGAAS